MKLHQAILLGLFSLAFMPAEAFSASTTDKAVEGICDVKKIYVASLGKGANLENYRHLMDKYLPEFGLPVVSNAAEGDAVLSGSLDATGKIQGDIWLKTASGVKLWSTEVTTASDEAAIKKDAKKTSKEITKHIRKQCRAKRGPGMFTIGIGVSK